MSKTLQRILKVNRKVNTMKVKYTGPFIYCGGGKLDDWNKKTEDS
ncbi:hypothetical protein ACFSTE_21065 [Aquimarina hainanensis]|uniref:Uncharacterized protein n=1 Tax=Aquimarina hainanensis TaxID=1578017 RepID=A0ABW5NG13_9FLAO